MKLEDLLSYNDIVIQCHDKPDADTIASGFALFKYLEKNGKSPRLVYTGTQKVTRGSLHEMIKKFQIPLEYLPEADGEAELLVTVDCRASEGNVSMLPCRNVAIIDHHSLKEKEELPKLHEIRTESDGYASCATVLWAMLKEAGIPVEEDGQLPTILYYGLYMDTQELKTAQAMDKNMLDELKFDRDIVTELQGVNLSFEEIGIMGRAYNSLHINHRHCFAVAQVETCDPDILGIVGDELMKVAGVDISVAYCLLEGDEGGKISVRCRRKGHSATDLIHWLVRSMGDDGGGTPTKAAGRVPKRFLEEACSGDEWDDLSGAVGRLLYKLLTDYFEIPPKKIETGQYDPDKVTEFCDAPAVLYRKKKVPVGYVKATDLFPDGQEILIRMLEGDTKQKVDQTLYIMIGVDGETYHSREDKLKENYVLTEEPFPVDPESPWQPKVYTYADRKVKLLAPYAKKCIAKDGALIWASRLNCRLNVFTMWKQWHLGEPGDWLVSRDTDRQDIYIIKKEIFEKTYERA